MAAVARDKLVLKLGTGNSILLSQMGGRGSAALVFVSASQGLHLLEAWVRSQKLELLLGTGFVPAGLDTCPTSLYCWWCFFLPVPRLILLFPFQCKELAAVFLFGGVYWWRILLVFLSFLKGHFPWGQESFLPSCRSTNACGCVCCTYMVVTSVCTSRSIVGQALCIF